MHFSLLTMIQLTLVSLTGCVLQKRLPGSEANELNNSETIVESLVLMDASETNLAPYLYSYTGEVEGEDAQKIVKELGGDKKQKFKNPLGIAFNEGRKWLTFRVKNPHPNEMTFVLENNFPWPSAWLISTTESGAVSFSRSGAFENSTDPKDALLPAHVIRFPPGLTTCFLGINTGRNPLAVQLRLWTPEAYQQHSRAYLLWLTCFFGAALALLLGNVVLVPVVRVRATIYYIITIPMFCLLSSVINGYFCLLPDEWRPVWVKLWPLFNLLTIVSSVQFTIQLLGFTRSTHPIALRLAHILCGLELLLAIAIYLPGPKFSFIAMNATTCLVFGLISVITLRALMLGNRLALYLAAGLLPVSSISVIDACALSGAFPGMINHPLGQFAAGLASSVCLSLILGAKIIAVRQKHEHLKISLKGVIADAQIDKLGSESLKIVRQPVEQEVTVMFVDIVGYSMIFRRIGGYQAFLSIKQVLHELSKIIHQHGGMIDKSLGDGILCFFGYDLSGAVSNDHAQMALQCALALQQHTLAKTLSVNQSSAEAQVFPQRIGINTGRVHIGNMGDEQRLDITISGEGVVLANRFESACEPYKVILGKSTRDQLDSTKVPENMLTPILIPIKHMQALMEAYTCNPFYDREQQLQETRAVFWRLHHIERIDQRQPVNTPLVFGTPFGDMTLVNFSNGGFCLDAAVFLGKGVNFELKLNLPLNDVQLKLISPLMVEVTWSSVGTDASYRHGVRIVGGNAAQRSLIYDFLSTNIVNALQSETQSAA